MGDAMCDCLVIVARVTDPPSSIRAIVLVTKLLEQRSAHNLDTRLHVCLALSHDPVTPPPAAALDAWQDESVKLEALGAVCVAFVTAPLNPEAEEARLLRSVPTLNHSRWLQGLGCKELAECVP